MSKTENFSGALDNRAARVEGNEVVQDIDKLSLYVVRHGMTKYLERKSVQHTGKWDPTLNDLVEGEREHILRTADSIAEDLDPEKHIVIFMSSPRARALRTADLLEEGLTKHGIEVYKPKMGSRVVEMLRSGGDKAPLVGPDNTLQTVDGTDPKDYSIWDEAEYESEQKRFKHFLSFFASIGKKNLNKVVNENREDFHGKTPVFVSVTHGEVVYAGIMPHTAYKESLIGSAFPDAPRYPRVQIPRGEAVKIDFDLNNPGKLELTATPQVSPSGEVEKRKLDFNFVNGDIRLDEEIPGYVPESGEVDAKQKFINDNQMNFSG